MSLQRLALRTKKSLSGLYSSHKDTAQASPVSVEAIDSDPRTPPKTPHPTYNEFGHIQGDDDNSPIKDSPSRRKRILGSLRSMSSLRSLRSAHGTLKKQADAPTDPEIPHTPVKEMPSLALNFEVSPPDQPMFAPATRKLSAASDIKIHHSSPITVPLTSRNDHPMTHRTPFPTDFAVETVPKSPTPLQTMSVHEVIISKAEENSSPPAFDVTVAVDPMPTPMPGTNLPLEDIVAPEIMVTSPSVPQLDCNGYFDIAAVADEKTTAATTYPGEAISKYHNSPSSMSVDNTGDYDDHLTYVVWDDPDIANEDKLEECGSKQVWSRSTGLYDGTGYGGGTETSDSYHSTNSIGDTTTDVFDTVTSMKEGSEVQSTAVSGLPDKNQLSNNQKPSTDDTVALQDIIRAYAGQMYHETMGDELDRLSDEVSVNTDVLYAEESATREMIADVNLSYRVMNRSLGG